MAMIKLRWMQMKHKDKCLFQITDCEQLHELPVVCLPRYYRRIHYIQPNNGKLNLKNIYI